MAISLSLVGKINFKITDSFLESFDTPEISYAEAAWQKVKSTMKKKIY